MSFNFVRFWLNQVHFLYTFVVKSTFYNHQQTMTESIANIDRPKWYIISEKRLYLQGEDIITGCELYSFKYHLFELS